MKLACILNLWDGDEHLEKCLGYIVDEVDLIVIVYQTVSNFGEEYCPKIDKVFFHKHQDKIVFSRFKPDFSIVLEERGYQNEFNKRKQGFEIAKEKGCTHFFHLDVDEFYPDFRALKSEFGASGADGSVCPIETYIGKYSYKVEPALKLYVPFIFEVKELGGRLKYSVDRTRTAQADKVVELSKPMHHASWVREDMDRKLRNSSARRNRRNELIKEEVERLMKEGPEGFKSRYFGGKYIKKVDWLS